MAAPQPIHLDTDIGDDIDDAWALTTCVRHPDLDLLSVTTVLGDTELRAAEARYLLELGGVRGVEVAAGTRDPLDRIVPIHRNNQADILTKDDEERLRKGRTDGVRFLAEQARKHEGLTLLHVGPITNIGRFVVEFPDDFARLSRIVMMAGHVMPNRPDPEYNAAVDPRATRTVFESAVHKTMIGLDVTLRCVMTQEDLDTIKGKDTPLGNAIIGMTALWQKAGHQAGQPPRMPCVHDPLAALVAADPSLVKLEPMHIDIDDAGRCIRGAGEPNVDVAVDVDPVKVRKKLVELVG